MLLDVYDPIELPLRWCYFENNFECLLCPNLFLHLSYYPVILLWPLTPKLLYFYDRRESVGRKSFLFRRDFLGNHLVFLNNNIWKRTFGNFNTRFGIKLFWFRNTIPKHALVCFFVTQKWYSCLSADLPIGVFSFIWESS